MTATFPLTRLRRLRQHPVLRSLVQETTLNLQDFVLPLFIKGREGKKTPIASMPGHFQIPLCALKDEIREIEELGISSVLLFGIPSHKDPYGSEAYHDHGIISEALRLIKEVSRDLLVISDLCFCEYTDHGHCGLLSERGGKLDVDNDLTLPLLAKQAVAHARAGADVIAPSGMIDGMVKTIREALDNDGFTHIPILSYAVKYHSGLYGPFRQAAEGGYQFGDRSTHQMDFANAKESLREAKMDMDEGADMLMVKPAHAYLDILYRIKEAYPTMPLAAYHTSGEFCMIKAAAEKGWIDEEKVAIEVLTGIKRAGADFIISYFTKDLAKWLVRF